MKFSNLLSALPLLASIGAVAEMAALTSVVPTKDNNFGIGETVSIPGAGSFIISGHELMFDGKFESDRQLPTQSNPCFSFNGQGNYTYARFLTPESFKQRNLKPVFNIRNEIVCVTGNTEPTHKVFDIQSGNLGQSVGALFFDKAKQTYSYYDMSQQKEVLAWKRLAAKDSGDGAEIWLDVQNGIAWGPRLDHKMNLEDALNGAESYGTSIFPAGSWEMPTSRPDVKDPKYTQYMGTHTRSWIVGLNQVLPDMEPSAASNWFTGDRLEHWLMVESAVKNSDGSITFKEDSSKLSYATGVGAVGKGSNYISGFLGLALNKNDLKYVRYVLKPAALERFLKDKSVGSTAQ